MRTPLLSLVFLAFSSSLSVAGSAAAGPPAVAPQPVVEDPSRANDFGCAMYGTLRGAPGNLFFSPTSMREALGLAYLGARGETASQMTTALRLDPDAAKSASAAKSEIAAFVAARGAASLTIANRLWIDRSFGPKPAFSTAALDAYGSPLDPVDFLGQPDPSRVTINGWVAKQTNDKIKDLLPPGSITRDNRLVITNAIWFKGDWEKAFRKAATEDESFFVSGTTPSKVPMMHQTSGFPLASADGAMMLEMKYGKSDLAMDVLLPDVKTGIVALEDRVVSGGIGKWTSGLRHEEVIVSFPKLTFTWSGSIKKPLTSLGMTTAFDGGRADFTGIADPRAAGGNLFVSDVVHKAFVAIDEEGTEAAAATGVLIAAETTAVQRPRQPVRFTADHPFLVVIRDTKHDRILFLGRVNDPKA